MAIEEVSTKVLAVVMGVGFTGLITLLTFLIRRSHQVAIDVAVIKKFLHQSLESSKQIGVNREGLVRLDERIKKSQADINAAHEKIRQNTSDITRIIRTGH